MLTSGQRVSMTLAAEGKRNQLSTFPPNILTPTESAAEDRDALAARTAPGTEL